MRPFLPETSAVGYLLYSEYSPLHLEHEDGFDSSFRQRFEDLLRAEDGKPLLGKQDVEQQEPTSSVNWLGRIIPLLKDNDHGQGHSITIGSSSSQQPVLQVEEQSTSFDAARQTRESNAGLETEQDLYERHFENLPRPLVTHSNPTPMLSREQGSERPRPSILSTLTTTERHVAPDGSVTTKTVLKRRFADGREESSESVETSPATRPSWPEQQAESSEAVPRIPKAKDHGKKGWFWSS